MIKHLLIIGTVLFVGTCQDAASLQTELAVTNNEVQSCDTAPFRYVVTNDWRKSSKVREIEVFMNPADFEPEKLKQLFQYLSRKYTEPEFLQIKVKTDWSQVQVPTDCPGSGASGDVFEKNYDFHRAEFFRRGENVYFYYTTELKTEKMEKVVISGNRQPKQRWESD